MKSISLIAALLLTSATSFAAASTADWPHVYEVARPSVVAVRSQGGICSGALIGPDLILTAHHCVQFLRPITIQWFAEDKMVREQTATISRWSRKDDLAILKLDAAVPYPVLKLAPAGELKVGTEHATIGHPFGMVLNFSDNLRSDFLFNFSVGRVSKINLGNNNFLSDMSVSPGNSGGPVLNEKAEIIGVVSAKVRESAAGDIDRIIHPTKIKELVDAAPKGVMLRDIGSSMDITLKRVHVTLKEEKEDINDFTDTAELRFYYKDRVIFGYEHSFSASENDIEYEGVTLGYHWYFESDNKIPFYLGTGIKGMNFNQYSEHWFWMVNSKFLVLDVEAGFNFKDGGESYLSFGLSF